MSERPIGFDRCLPGIVVELTLATVPLAMGETVFPDPFLQVFSHQAVVALSVAIDAASALWLVSLFLHFRGDEGKSRSIFCQTIRKTRMAFR